MTIKHDAPVLERHRRMAASALIDTRADRLPGDIGRWVDTGDADDIHDWSWHDSLPLCAQFAANLERDAHAAGKAEGFAEGVEASAAVADAIVTSRRRT